ncbi:MAG: hypothetical protein QNJ15_08420 [Erythrobacter sp.]|nr:hypothetical protein [Erythrobacter sp.]
MLPRYVEKQFFNLILKNRVFEQANSMDHTCRFSQIENEVQFLDFQSPICNRKPL